MSKDALFELMLVVPVAGGRHFSLAQVVEGAISSGVDAVQLRDKTASAEEIARTAETLTELVHNCGAKLIINSWVDIALKYGADGVHLVSRGVDYRAVVKQAGESLIVGCSTHNAGEVARAAEAGMDYAIIGPVYPTPSKAGMGEPLGTARLQEIAGGTHIPLIAIGGINPGRIAEVLSAGARGVAVMGYILESLNPEESARELRQMLDRHRAG
jgi:thiamine-phosphate pyrophosphorylase